MMRSRRNVDGRTKFESSEAAILTAISEDDVESPALKADRLPTSLSGPNAKACVTASFAIDRRAKEGTPRVLAMVTVAATGSRDISPALQVRRLALYERGTNKKI